MNLTSHYASLWNRSIQKFKAGEFELDPLIDSENDARYGITLLARPSSEVKERICNLLDPLKSTAPNQYFYPATDLHVTILSIISCYRGFTPDQVDPAEYCHLIQSVVDTLSPFCLTFHGITASPSSIMIQGFPEDEQLNTLRNELRNTFKNSNLQHSIDKRYHLKTAHITAVRFKQPLLDQKAFLKSLTVLKDRSFGSCITDELELVSNDWYQKKENVRQIKTFSLTKSLK